MILINLNSPKPVSVADNEAYQVLCKTGTPFLVWSNPNRVVKPRLAPLPRLNARPSLPRELTEFLLGKAPLRLIVSSVKAPQIRHFRVETLECGHETDQWEPWCWDEKGHLLYLGFTAKRRRCLKCKAALAATSLPPKKPNQSVTEIPERKKVA